MNKRRSQPIKTWAKPLSWVILALAVGLILLAPILVLGSRESNVDSKIRELEIKVQKLEQTKQLKIEGINETRKVEPVSQTPVSLGTTPRVISVSGGELADKVKLAFAPFGQSENAVIVARCESVNFKQAVVYGPQTGKAGERGVMQIHPVHIKSMAQYGFTWDDMFNPDKNLAYAVILYKSVNLKWSPTWTCATNNGII